MADRNGDWGIAQLVWYEAHQVLIDTFLTLGRRSRGDICTQVNGSVPSMREAIDIRCYSELALGQEVLMELTLRRKANTGR